MGAMRRRGSGTVYRRGRSWWIQYFVRGLIVPESSHSTEKADAENLLKQRIGERRDRQIRYARLGYPSDCVCCDCETGNACPNCLGENLEYGTYDFGTDRETGYVDSGERYYCRDCGASGDVDDTVPALVMLPQATPKLGKGHEAAPARRHGDHRIHQLIRWRSAASRIRQY